MDDQTLNTATSPTLSGASPANPVEPPKNQEHHLAHWIIVLLLLIFPPYAWYYMYKHTKYHKWFAYYLWLNAISQLIIYEYQVFIAVPQLKLFYENAGVSIPETNINQEIIPIAAISLIQIVVGYILYTKTKGPVGSYRKSLNLIFIIFIITYVFGFIAAAYSMVLPLYKLIIAIQ